MKKLEQKEYIKEFSAYTKEINSSKEKATEFYQKAGITTPTGQLKRVYYHHPEKIGYKK